MVVRILNFIKTLTGKKARDLAQEHALVKVLMVCRANICRSPMAEGALRYLLEGSDLAGRIFVDSAGTHTRQNGLPADQRGQQVAARRGVPLAALRSRRLELGDLDRFDYILAMDRDNQDYLLGLCETAAQREKVHLLMDFAAGSDEREVPDPYFGALSGFERVMDMVQEGTQGLLHHIRSRYRL